MPRESATVRLVELEKNHLRTSKTWWNCYIWMISSLTSQTSDVNWVTRLRKKDYLQTKKLKKWFCFMTFVCMQKQSRKWSSTWARNFSCMRLILQTWFLFLLPPVQINAVIFNRLAVHKSWRCIKITRWLFCFETTKFRKLPNK